MTAGPVSRNSSVAGQPAFPPVPRPYVLSVDCERIKQPRQYHGSGEPVEDPRARYRLDNQGHLLAVLTVLIAALGEYLEGGIVGAEEQRFLAVVMP